MIGRFGMLGGAALAQVGVVYQVLAASGETFLTLGSIVAGVVILAASALFTIRSNVAKVWRETAEGERARAEEWERKYDEQRKLKHEARGERDALKLTRDLTPVLTLLGDLRTEEARTGAAVAELAAAVHRLFERKGA
jgi:hypothetical protein